MIALLTLLLILAELPQAPPVRELPQAPPVRALNDAPLFPEATLVPFGGLDSTTRGTYAPSAASTSSWNNRTVEAVSTTIPVRYAVQYGTTWTRC